MKILVTGATGFIGNYIVKELLRRKVAVIASSSRAKEQIDSDWTDKVIYRQCNIHEIGSENLFHYFEKPDHAIHLAWGGLSNFKDEFHITKELPAQKHFVRQLISSGLTSLTVTGTCLEYGNQEGELTEDMPAQPVVPYAVAKNELRQYLEHIGSTIPFDLRWVRLFYMYGKGQNPKSILAQLDAAIKRGDSEFNMSMGEQWRDYLPVETIAQIVVIFAVQRYKLGIMNCCSNKPISIRNLVEQYLKSHNKTLRLNLGYYPYPDYEPFRFWGSNKKQQSILEHESSRTI